MGRVKTDVDAFVGGRIKQRRKALAMSQTALGEALGVTFQQIQKYERGHNRVGAGALYKMADALKVPISYFFDGLPTLANSDDAASRRAIEFVYPGGRGYGRGAKSGATQVANGIGQPRRHGGASGSSLVDRCHPGWGGGQLLEGQAGSHQRERR